MEVNNKKHIVSARQYPARRYAESNVCGGVCKKCIDIAFNYNTVYMNGVFGWPVTQYTIDRKRQENPSWYTNERGKLFYNTNWGRLFRLRLYLLCEGNSFGDGTEISIIFKGSEI